MEYFKHPLDFEDTVTLSADIIKNLELAEGLTSASTSLLGDVCLSEAARASWTQSVARIAVDARAAKDMHILASAYAGPTDGTIADTYLESHTTFANDSSFWTKFQYLELERLRPLNAWQPIAYVLTLANYGAPVFNLLLPFLSLALALALIYLRTGSVTYEQTRAVVWRVTGERVLGPLLSGGTAVAKAYGIMIAAAYVYNVYSHVRGCMKFHASFATMTNHLDLTAQLLQRGVEAATNLRRAAPASTMASFREHLSEGVRKAQAAADRLTMHSNSTRGLPGLNSAATTLHKFYRAVFDTTTVEAARWCAELLGFTEVVGIVQRATSSGTLCPARFTSSGNSKFTGLVHPGLAMRGVAVVPNTVRLGKSMVLTGPNASGKTTLVKAVAVNQILCQQWGVGAFEAARVRPVGNITCYMNVPDTGARDSLFQAEARRCKGVLASVEDSALPSLCLFDELYSGTNPDEATAASVAYLSHLMSSGPHTRFLLTTHLDGVASGLSRAVSCMRMTGEVTAEAFSPHYRCAPGVSDLRSGFLVLRELGYPEEITSALPIAPIRSVA
jgi:hypothetical protein